MQKNTLKFAFNVECQQSTLQAKLQLSSYCARAKHYLVVFDVKKTHTDTYTHTFFTQRKKDNIAFINYEIIPHAQGSNTTGKGREFSNSGKNSSRTFRH